MSGGDLIGVVWERLGVGGDIRGRGFLLFYVDFGKVSSESSGSINCKLL